MSTLQERIKAYLRDQKRDSELESTDEEYENFMRQKEEADLQQAEEHLEKLKLYR